MNKEFMEDMLYTLFGWCSADIEFIQDCKYDSCDWYDNYLSDVEGTISINDIIYAMFSQCKYNLMTRLDDKIAAYYERLEDEPNLQEAINEMETMDIDNDIETFINCLDSHIYILEDKRALYDKYLSEEIEAEEIELGIASIR